jgi:hypothetical protein
MTTANKTAPPRFLVLLDPEHNPHEVPAILGALEAAASKPATFIDSAWWYVERFPSCGTMESWVNEAVTGKQYGSGEPYFHGFVLACTSQLSEPMKRLVEQAGHAGKPVYTYDGHKLSRVKE